MASEDDETVTPDTVLRELDSLRKRLDQATGWMNDGETTVAATALAEDVQRLCREISLCADLHRARDLLACAKRRLEDFEKLLGLH